MMDAFRDYVLHLIATALLCAVVLRFAQGCGAVKMMIKLLCGIVLSYSVIQPVMQLKLPELTQFITEFRAEADRTAQSGKETSIHALSESISQGTEAYILEKAKALNLDVVVEVELSEDEIPVPVAVSVVGNVAPYAKSVLSETIVNDLNIPKEKQTWIFQ